MKRFTIQLRHDTSITRERFDNIVNEFDTKKAACKRFNEWVATHGVDHCISLHDTHTGETIANHDCGIEGEES